jgi:hypothetical protein
MLKIATFVALFATSAAADNCQEARNLAANYWAMIGGLSDLLDACENDASDLCQIARETDQKIKDTGTPNGTALLIQLPMALCPKS